MSSSFRIFKKVSVLFFISLFTSFGLKALIIDGTSTVTIWDSRASFPTSPTVNAVSGFAVIDSGFALADLDTTLTFSSFFPLKGSSGLAGGTMYLQRDLYTEKPFDITSKGNIYGNNYGMHFGSSITEFDFPDDSSSNASFNLIDEKSTSAVQINAVDWSYTNSYLAIGTNESGTQPELKVYYMDGVSITLTASADVSTVDNQHLYSVRFHPTQSMDATYIALGTRRPAAGALSTQIYKYQISNGSFSQIYASSDLADYAVGWFPSGDYLITNSGTSANTQIHLSAFLPDSSEILIGQDTAGIGRSETVQNNTIAWDGVGQYFAVGYETNAVTTGSDFCIFHFDAATITATLGAGGDNSISTSIGADVVGLDWSPTGSYIAVGVNDGTARLQIFYHDVTSGTLTKTFIISESKTVNSVQWASDGNSLLVGLDAGAGTELRTYDFNKNLTTLTLGAGVESSVDQRSVRWRPFTTDLASGSTTLISVYDFGVIMEFNNVKLFFDTDVTFNDPVTFSGTCLIHGDDSLLEFTGSTIFNVTDGTTLTLKDLSLNNLESNWLTLRGTSNVAFDNVVFESDPNTSGMTTADGMTFTNNCRFEKGFTLPTNVDLETTEPFSGALNLNTNSLTLYGDLLFSGEGSLDGSTENEYATFLADNDNTNRTMYFNRNQAISADYLLSFSSDLVLDGNQYALDLNNSSSISIGNGKTLLLRNWSLENLKSDWVVPSAGTLAFDNVVFESNPYSSGIADGDGMTFTNNCRFEKGFTLPIDVNLETSEPFSGALNLNSNTLSLYGDLLFSGEGSLDGTNGTIGADNDNTNRTLSFNADQTFDNAILTFNNSIIVNGNGHQFDLDLGGKFVIAAGKTLRLVDMTIKNAPSDWIVFSDANSALVLDGVKFIGSKNLSEQQMKQVSGTFEVEY